ncbi:MAG: hypothetical protein N4A76_17345 [Firmicutes bacterium]|jgi:hypothetical protein|nr:hypothetical protein [Bacillota bacterium]
MSSKNSPYGPTYFEAKRNKIAQEKKMNDMIKQFSDDVKTLVSLVEKK